MWDCGVLECRSVGVLECGSVGVWECGSVELLGCFCLSTFEAIYVRPLTVKIKHHIFCNLTKR